MNGKELVKLLKGEGFELKSITGSHHKLIRGKQIIVVPVHGSKDLKPGLLNRILKDAGLK